METRRKPTPSALHPAANVAPDAGLFFPPSMPTTAKQLDWPAIRAQLTGARLAVYDDLSQVASLRCTPDWSVANTEALNWLHRHRLAYPEGFSDMWRSRSISAAIELWEKEGPANENRTAEEPETKAVHTAAYGQQAQFFDMDGYKGP